MKSWGAIKAAKLLLERNVTFEQITLEGELVGAEDATKNTDIRFLIFRFHHDIWVIVQRKSDGQCLTTYPSRKFRKDYL